MFEEPVRFLQDLISHDRSVLDCLYADHAFVKCSVGETLWRCVSSGRQKDWIRVEGVGTSGRGGLIPMSVFLTQNSPGLLSPVKRGYWVVKRLLGEYIPAPPPNVPDLPEDESRLGELTLADAAGKTSRTRQLRRMSQSFRFHWSGL